MMNQRERDSLDRYITGNYGEDQFRNEFNDDCVCGHQKHGNRCYGDGVEDCDCQDYKQAEQDEEEAREDALIRRGEERDEARFFGD